MTAAPPRRKQPAAGEDDDEVQREEEDHAEKSDKASHGKGKITTYWQIGQNSLALDTIFWPWAAS